MKEFCFFLGASTAEEYFVAGMAFVVMVSFFGFLFEIPFAIRELAWMQRRKHNCYLRFFGGLDTHCHYSGCPRAEACPYYQKFSFKAWLCSKKKKP